MNLQLTFPQSLAERLSLGPNGTAISLKQPDRPEPTGERTGPDRTDLQVPITSALVQRCRLGTFGFQNEQEKLQNTILILKVTCKFWNKPNRTSEGNRVRNRTLRVLSSKCSSKDRASRRLQGERLSPWRAGRSSGPGWSRPGCRRCQTSGAGTEEGTEQQDVGHSSDP